ncbi:MAG: flagellar motor switch protein FliM [Spirochaetales bacterium]|nr:flagellar motor switch protein FliM [Spirochaetales bacterium]
MSGITKLGGIATAEEAENLKVKLYDFRRPDKFSKEQLRTVSIVHDTFARLISTKFSSLARQLCHVSVAGVNQMTYEEFIRSIPDPTTMGVIQMYPLICNTLVEIDPDVQFAMLDRLMGGTGEPLPGTRDLTDFERVITEELYGHIMLHLSESWQGILETKPRLGTIETRPMFAQIVPPTEMIVLVSFKVTMAKTEGMINFCIPYLTIEPVLEKLSAKFMYSSYTRKDAVNPDIDTSIFDTKVRIITHGPKLSIQKLGTLQKGSRFPLSNLDNATGNPNTANSPWYLEAGKTKISALVKHPKKWEFKIIDVSALGEKAIITQKEALKAQDTQTQISMAFTRLEKKLEELTNAQTQIADEISLPPGKGRVITEPFAFVRLSDSVRIAEMLTWEHPQLVALILWYLEPEPAALVLGALPETARPEIIRRIAVMDRVDPAILAIIERMFEKKLSAFSGDVQLGKNGIETAVGILNMAQRQVERNIIETLEKTAPEISEGIKRRMFVFEDIVLLDRKALEKLTAAADPGILALALKGVDDDIAGKITDVLSSERKKEIEERKQKSGKVRLKDVEEAQLQIVQKIRELEENGDIFVLHPDERIVE